MKLTDYPQTSALQAADILITDGSSGTKKIAVGDAATAILDAAGIRHTCLYRGKNLGTSYTTAQKNAIQSGTFTDIWVGDYWVINNVTWRVVDLDYYYGVYNDKTSTAFNTHHAVIMPDSSLYTSAMHNSDSATGYVLSDLHASGLTQARNTINSAFPNGMLSYFDVFTDSVSNDVPSGGFYNTTAELPSITQLLGYSPFTVQPRSVAATNATGQFTPLLGSQFAAMAFNRSLAHSPSVVTWTRDFIQGTVFGAMSSSGFGVVIYQKNTNGVRPFFLLG